MDYSAASGGSPWATSPLVSRSDTDVDVPQQSLTESEEAHGGEDETAEQTVEQPAEQPPEQPVEESRRPASTRYHQISLPRPQQPQYKLQTKITALERTGKKDPIFRFDVYTNLPKFRTTQFRDVRRTHSEFQKLADHLTASNPEALVPAVPPSASSAGVGTEEDETLTKSRMQRWLSVVCSNEVLMRDEEIIFFVESDFGYSPVVRKKQPATGMRRKMLKQFAPPPDDTPELLEARPVVKAFYLGSMDCQQKIDRLVKNRRSLGVAESDLGLKLQALQTQETHPGLAQAYRKLGRVIQNTGDFHAAQGTAEATALSDTLAYHSSDAFIVKETLTNRHILLRDLVQAQQATRAKHTAADRLKASSSVRSEKVDEALYALTTAQRHEESIQKKTQQVTNNLLIEKRKWFMRTAADVRSSIRDYAIRQIEAERRTLAMLEQVRPDVRNIDSSGGLSRLGRESHPVVSRRSSLASSQGPKGDAWSGVPRRADGLNRSISGSLMAGQSVPEENGEQGDEGDENCGGRKRGTSTASVLTEGDSDRIDARNAASRLAQTTF
ncbi:vacuolar protein sorting-associated protein Vps17 [Piedraia hortae CBS 480.64]|uniref:Vacuolar protein sorting-associated protein 17 n=1 Tax=Piedraia hortae CBS 480.64 TaxID=1314780 RepID=A0A6A7C5W6_9PEZI|nr:vacuolar protein sorting-associated protein Vps17 [Piedraia hortae CBS 480.64]